MSVRRPPRVITRADFDALDARPIPDFTTYSATRDGEIISRRGREFRYLHQTKIPSGYLCVALRRDDGELKTARVHRMVAMAFLGKRNGLVRHINGKRDDARLVNLRWGTAKENAADRIAHGTAPRGEMAGNSILTETQVRTIRERIARGAGPLELGREYGVDERTIRKLRDGETWRFVA